jgi:ribulose-5-phosphate 4-epimerase/fuculose-1-phosphate aldolase
MSATHDQAVPAPVAPAGAPVDALGGPVRRGGLDVWSPSVTPPIGVQLTDEQSLACTFRILARDGFAENLSGHITWLRPGDDTMLVNPWGLWWRELSASDICTVDLDAKVLSGRWDVTPAVHIHTELHRRRSDARVVVHNHPYHVSVLAALGVLPELVHQTGALFLDDLRFVDEYAGEIDSPALGAELAEHIGDATTVLLANHGVIVTGETIALALYRAASIDRVCRLAYDVMVSGRPARRMPTSTLVGMKQSLVERAADVYYAGAVRLLLRDEPDVLD